MEYSIKELAELTGVSTRTLRYYDQIDLLKPYKKTESGYRVYSEAEVDKLQVVLFYKSLAFELSEIKQLVTDPNFSVIDALKEQCQVLLAKQQNINDLLTTISVTIQDYQGGKTMNDQSKFEVFKKQQLQNNEEQYGQEIRQEYGDKVVDEANKQYSSMTSDQYQQMNELESELIKHLKELKQAGGDVNSSLAKQVFEEHQQWLQFSWPKYDKSMHRGLADMYLADERFGDYYNKKANEPVIQLLHDVIYNYTKQ